MKHLAKKSIEKRLKHLGKTVKCGFHSGIPYCCIHFYVTKWLWYQPKEKEKYWERILRAEKKFNKKIKYIVCPDCIKDGKRWIDKLKSCHCYHYDECHK